MNDQRMLERIGNLFGICFLLSLGLLFLWLGIYLAIGGLAFDIQSEIFGVSKEDFVRLNYFGLTFTKVVAFVFFLFPYLAVKILNRKGPSSAGASRLSGNAD